MAGRGPAPNEDRSQVRTRHAPQRGEWIDLPVDWAGEIPPLPEIENGEWHLATVGAWESWWRDPAASQWTPADWTGVLQLLAFTEDFNRGSKASANEMRLRSDGLGLTQKGKRDLRWRVVAGEVVKPAPRPAAKRRAKLQIVN